MMLDVSDDQPFDDLTAQVQHEALLEVLGSAAKRILDLGCGAGRLLVPVACAGHVVVGVDQRADALAECKKSLAQAGAAALLVECNFIELDRDAISGAFDAVLCLGNTLMTIPDVGDAVRFMSDARELLKPDGMFIIDDLPHEHWPELTEGYWMSGTSEDGTAQIAWHETDALFALRRDEHVTPNDEALRDDEQRYRLWTDGALRLAAQLAGLSAPERHDSRSLLIMRPGT